MECRPSDIKIYTPIGNNFGILNWQVSLRSRDRRHYENVSQEAGIGNGVYGVDIVTASYVQFGFRQFRSGIFDVKDAPHICSPIVENVDNRNNRS
ncbi:hypothetical protein TNCV_2102021 [Trichonephila clavipes]|nr:hypothetical protein TNCV_2102021 [Trichonephila clavipes]